MADQEISKIVSAIEKFPSKITSRDGRILKQSFEQIELFKTNCENTKSLRFKYRKIINDEEYLLMEEYLFNERETILELKHAITVNYYLNRKLK